MSGYQVISPERARALLATQSVTVLDLRDHRSYRAGHIDGALLLHDGLMQALVKDPLRKGRCRVARARVSFASW